VWLKLMNDFYSTLEEPGLKALYLFVSPGNPVAARVYGRIGFIGLETGVPDERTEDWAELGWEGVKLLDF
jgi:RimJ/RimL family protein N-acetyltransferase